MNRSTALITRTALAVLACAATLTAAAAASTRSTQLRVPDPPFRMEVLIDGVPRPEHHGRETTYIEALRGHEYTIRLTNPLPVRVAVALAVDGLNTIDATTTDARQAAKWVLGPFQTVEIPGWQVSGNQARRFVFTGERGSYGAWLGKTDNLGVIEAVFFREKDRYQEIQALSARAPAAARERSLSSRAMGEPAAEALDDSYAATGMGDRQSHRVTRVRLDLEREPAAVVRLRYEFRPELERLGVLRPHRTPLERREGARGFPGYCPEPPRR